MSNIVARLRSGYHNLEQEIIGGLTHDRRCLEAADEIERLRQPFRNADDKDWEHLFRMLPQSGHGQFWRSVLTEARAALEKQ